MNTTARGYGRAHQVARRILARTLPAPCGYCAETIEPGAPFNAAHRVDGDAGTGWMIAHPACNQRAKRRPWRSAARPPRPHPGLVS
ncbi:MAG TPA: hypothetical protein VLM76_09390 [Patescibacteria group bacterium]|nr:hypothetical protein [Patescibacteria group bacterium]